MPQLILTAPGHGQSKTFSVFKKITTIGHSTDNDIVVDMVGVEPCHAHILYDGKAFMLSEADRGCEVIVNGKRRRSHELADQDIFQIGSAQLSFALFDEVSAAEVTDGENEATQALETLRTLHNFSERLFETYDLDTLLNRLMDDVIALTGADKGFLILLSGETPIVRVARNIERKALDTTQIAFSDSIVQKVLTDRNPVIVSDALNDREFSSSTSIINLRLCSVMCVPLVSRGELLGLIYVGNDNIVNLFHPSSLETLRIYASHASLIIMNALLVNELQLDKQQLETELAELRYGEMIGACDSMRDIYAKVDKIAKTDINVLISGETGTGKELIARELHNRSDRGRGPFIALNCGAIPENLLESELFGHVRGAFTGAVAASVGKFEAATGGTFFLDEVGEMPLSLQVKLLRAIQEKQITRVGETRSRNVDIRILAATNRDLRTEAAAGRFREDLYYRLNVITLHLPPLRERGDDIVLLARYLLNKYTREYGGKAKDFSKDALTLMRRYQWPGNIRELENRIKKAIIFCTGPKIQADSLDLENEGMTTVLPLHDAKEQFQRTYINDVLRLNNGNRTKTATDLDVDPRTIFRHLEKEREEDDL